MSDSTLRYDKGCCSLLQTLRLHPTVSVKRRRISRGQAQAHLPETGQLKRASTQARASATETALPHAVEYDLADGFEGLLPEDSPSVWLCDSATGNTRAAWQSCSATVFD
ncbi:hypothetical protein WJX73_001502 [Symbiochloris irregularis]|uniref:Uncharacterized protein n=1 Tax=Symbiochloris irregularis TaxID=706552 RepID=A0AAW1PQ69_9CHLO